MMRRKILAVLAVTLFIATAILPMVSSSEGSSTDDTNVVWLSSYQDGLEVKYTPNDITMYFMIGETHEKANVTLTYASLVSGKPDSHTVTTPLTIVANTLFGIDLPQELISEKDMIYEVMIGVAGKTFKCQLNCKEYHSSIDIDDEGTRTETKTTDPIEEPGEVEGSTVAKSVVETTSKDVAGNEVKTRTDVAKTTYEGSDKVETTATTVVTVTDASGQVKDKTTTVTNSTTNGSTEKVGDKMTESIRTVTTDKSGETSTQTEATTTRTDANTTVTESSTTIHKGEKVTYIDSKVTTTTDKNVETVRTESTTTSSTKTVVADESVTTNTETAGETKVNTSSTYTNKDTSGNVVSVITYSGSSTHKDSNTNVVTSGTAYVKDEKGKEIEKIETSTTVKISGGKTSTESTETTTDIESGAVSVVKTNIVDETKSTTATIKAVTTVVQNVDKTNATGFITSDTTVVTDGSFDSKYVQDGVSHATQTIKDLGITGTVDKYVNYNTTTGKVQYTIGTEALNTLRTSTVGFKISGSDCTVAYDSAIVSQLYLLGKPVSVDSQLSGSLNAAQRRVIGDNAYVNLALYSGGTLVEKFNGLCTFTISFNGIPGMNYDLSCVNSDGSLEKGIPFVYDAYDGVLIGQTSHHSVFAVFPEGYVPPAEDEKDNTMIIVAVVVILIVLLLLAYYYDKQRKAKAAASFEQPVQQQAPAQQPVNNQAPVQEQQAAPATESQSVQTEPAQPAEPQQPTNDTQSSWDKENKPNQ